MSGFDRVLSLVEDALAAGALAAAVGLTIVSVILRYGFNTGIFWAQEAVIYLVIFSTFIGAVVTLRHNEHVNVDILPVFLGERGKWFFALVGGAITLLYCAIFGFYSWLLITEPAARNTVTPALGVPLWFVELALPIGFTLMFLRSLEIVYRTARGRQTFPEAEQNELMGYAEEIGLEDEVRDATDNIAGPDREDGAGR
ncbi:MAG: TRAP transporter small permease [Actinomycetota bacterium]|jgi:C4-dicarboxylate transporter DctQ subunit|nr:TRAP transporter small permease [Actinomycetota bacterium]